MFDIHPPHEKIQGFRDFLLHLLTITIGLLIALGLEAGVERLHHRKLREEAETNLRQEIRDNQKDLSTSHNAIGQEKANLLEALKFLQSRATAQPSDIRAINLGYAIDPLSDASWRTATATGTVSYMDYSHVQKYAAAYHLQGDVTQLQKETLNEFLQLQSYFIFGFDPKKMSAEEARAAALEVRRTLAHLVALDQIEDGLGKTYGDALSEH